MGYRMFYDSIEQSVTITHSYFQMGIMHSLALSFVSAIELDCVSFQVVPFSNTLHAAESKGLKLGV